MGGFISWVHSPVLSFYPSLFSFLLLFSHSIPMSYFFCSFYILVIFLSVLFCVSHCLRASLAECINTSAIDQFVTDITMAQCDRTLDSDN